MSTRVAIVTGGNKGIGLAIVRALCRDFQGDVYLTARDVGRGQAAVASLSSEGLKSSFQQLDINDGDSIRAAAAFFKDKYGGVDVLINNAAIAFKVADTTPFAAQAEETLKTNFFATRDVLTTFMPLIKAGGRVVNVSSFVSCRTLNQCSPELQQRFRSEDISEEELAGLMQRFVDKAKAGQHKQDGWPETAYGVSKTGLTSRTSVRGSRYLYAGLRQARGLGQALSEADSRVRVGLEGGPQELHVLLGEAGPLPAAGATRGAAATGGRRSGFI
ncbi:Carbonyl reductase [NADPH] 1 [Oryzias melastigma]|uniref:Carbonyl reductase [NADPH] 1 n=1 Tax=Oryzias melastigma TaxID=30732 RepID=A0A834FNH6_ORYME|nr:Carbonyl reductase [NADPH] 1 [Oryzias melastigma]